MRQERLLLALAALASMPAQPAEALTPANPDRPMAAATCREALGRVREAAMGSPLISAEENREVLLEALDQAEELCGEQSRDRLPDDDPAWGRPRRTE